MADVSIVILDNGPLIVKGEVNLLDSEQNEFPKQDQIALCRCGASQNRPFCDGAHAKAGFSAVDRAPQA